MWGGALLAQTRPRLAPKVPADGTRIPEEENEFIVKTERGRGNDYKRGMDRRYNRDHRFDVFGVQAIFLARASRNRNLSVS